MSPQRLKMLNVRGVFGSLVATRLRLNSPRPLAGLASSLRDSAIIARSVGSRSGRSRTKLRVDSLMLTMDSSHVLSILYMFVWGDTRAGASGHSCASTDSATIERACRQHPITGIACGIHAFIGLLKRGAPVQGTATGAMRGRWLIRYHVCRHVRGRARIVCTTLLLFKVTLANRRCSRLRRPRGQVHG